MKNIGQDARILLVHFLIRLNMIQSNSMDASMPLHFLGQVMAPRARFLG